MSRRLLSLLLCAAPLWVAAQTLTILHTNDTHSHIDAEGGVGGVLQRKALIDSVRAADRNVLLVDAGDAVQGTLFFKLFGGDVEYPLMDMMGYDIRILGNHEFDNGLPSLAGHLRRAKSALLSANYDFTGTPLQGMFAPYVIKKIDGKKVGFMGLNIDPHGIIAAENWKGIVPKDIIATAQATADDLRARGCAAVVAVTHIGYSNDTPVPMTTDVELARATTGIDAIISAHSHEVVSPASGPERPNVVQNAAGRPVLIAQTGRYGALLGLLKLDLSGRGEVVRESKMIPVAGVDPGKFDKKIEAFIGRYQAKVDSINARAVAWCPRALVNSKHYTLSAPLSNLAVDIVQQYAVHVLDSIGTPYTSDLAIMNCGGVRVPMPEGPVTEGEILSMFPFANYVVVVEMSGERLSALLAQAMAQQGQAPSWNVLGSYSSTPDKAEGILVDGQPIDPARTYHVATIDYLATGGDYLSEMVDAPVVWRDTRELCAVVMRYICALGAASVPVAPDPRPRFLPAHSLQ